MIVDCTVVFRNYSKHATFRTVINNIVTHIDLDKSHLIKGFAYPRIDV